MNGKALLKKVEAFVRNMNSIPTEKLSYDVIKATESFIVGLHLDKSYLQILKDNPADNTVTGNGTGHALPEIKAVCVCVSLEEVKQLMRNRTGWFRTGPKQYDCLAELDTLDSVEIDIACELAAKTIDIGKKTFSDLADTAAQMTLDDGNPEEAVGDRTVIDELPPEPEVLIGPSALWDAIQRRDEHSDRDNHITDANHYSKWPPLHESAKDPEKQPEHKQKDFYIRMNRNIGIRIGDNLNITPEQIIFTDGIEKGLSQFTDLVFDLYEAYTAIHEDGDRA